MPLGALQPLGFQRPADAVWVGWTRRQDAVRRLFFCASDLGSYASLYIEINVAAGLLHGVSQHAVVVPDRLA
jgi:hypothetical protein